MICLCSYLLNSYPSELENQVGLSQLPGVLDKAIASCDKHLQEVYWLTLRNWWRFVCIKAAQLQNLFLHVCNGAADFSFEGKKSQRFMNWERDRVFLCEMRNWRNWLVHCCVLRATAQLECVPVQRQLSQSLLCIISAIRQLLIIAFLVAKGRLTSS